VPVALRRRSDILVRLFTFLYIILVQELIATIGVLGESTRTNQNSNPPKTAKKDDMKENDVVVDCVEVGCDAVEEELHPADLAATQELTARNINPMKLVMLLRTRFGLGRYEIQVRLPTAQYIIGHNCKQRMRNVYNIRTPRCLSDGEIAGCGWD
jgi:hypothetical protein